MTLNNNNTIYLGPIYFADGRPVPLILTEEEVAELLRLDNGTNTKFTLQNYRQKGVLKGTQIGKRVRYTLEEVIRFLRQQTAD